MQPNKWKSLKDDPGNHMESIILGFDDSESDVYTYKIYSDGTIFFAHTIKYAKAIKISDGTLVQEEYAFYQAPEGIYKDLVAYLKPKYEKTIQ